MEQILKLNDIPFKGYPIKLEINNQEINFSIEYIKWNFLVNIDTMEYIQTDELPSGFSADEWKSLNDWNDLGKVEIINYLNETTYNCKKDGINYERFPYKKIMDWFKKKGYNVTKEALEHNYKWSIQGYKCGFRDEENGYFLFTPCADLNPLSFSASKLFDGCDWQEETYEW